MTPHEFVALVESSGYKPAYNVQAVYDTRCMMVWVKMFARVPDANHPESTVPLFSAQGISAEEINGMSNSDVAQFLFRCWEKFEEHECREWFTIGGERIFDPHKNKI